MSWPPYGVRRRLIGGALAAAVTATVAVATAPTVAANADTGSPASS
ncbi:hypothetical protein BH20ACT5_BH20ACT5_17850 [soil metagenome]